MSAELSPADARFRQIMTDAARRILVDGDPPYDVGMQLMGALHEVLTTADLAGGAFAMWGWLTDGIDGPPSYARGLSEGAVEDLMRLAAQAWLDLDPTPSNLLRYLDRWKDWPDSVRNPPD